MFEPDESVLLKKIKKLENELKEKEQESNFLKTELSEVNYRLEKLIESSHYELKILKKIQEHLVPTEFPNIAGFEFSTKYLPSAIKGGDYFDVFDVSEKMRFGMVMSCSSGYGMSALLMSVLMKFSGFQLARKIESATEIASAIRSELSTQLSDIDQASLFFGMMNRRTHRLEFALMGDIRVFHYDYGSGELVHLKGRNPKIQKNIHGELHTEEITLNPRDRVIICSEGVFENTDKTEKCLTSEQLSTSLKKVVRASIHELRNEVLFQAEKFSMGSEIRRDRTVIALEVKDRVIKLAKG